MQVANLGHVKLERALAAPLMFVEPMRAINLRVGTGATQSPGLLTRAPRFICMAFFTVE